MSQIINNGGTTPLNDVTQRSRITGRTRTVDDTVVVPDTFVPSLHWGPALASVIVGLAVTAMLIMIGVASGLIAGDDTTNGDEAQGILAAIGAWSVIALALGSFIGSFVGGRLTRWMDRLSIATHTLVSWGVATLLALALVSLVSIGFATTATSVATTATAAEVTDDSSNGAAAAANGANAAGSDATDATGTTGAARGNDAGSKNSNANGNNTDNAKAADNTGDVLGGAGWAIAVGMILSLVASAAGWFLGSRRRLTDIEREEISPTTVPAV
jgi:hypothetical protein